MSIRVNKIASLIQEELSLIFLHKVQDPELGLVTITHVKLTADLKLAKIYLSVFEKEKRDYVLEHVDSIKGYIRSELAHRVRIKNVPELDFYIDDTSDYVEKIERILNKIHKDDIEKNNTE